MADKITNRRIDRRTHRHCSNQEINWCLLKIGLWQDAGITASQQEPRSESQHCSRSQEARYMMQQHKHYAHKQNSKHFRRPPKLERGATGEKINKRYTTRAPFQIIYKWTAHWFHSCHCNLADKRNTEHRTRNYGKRNTDGRTLSTSYVWPVPLPDNETLFFPPECEWSCRKFEDHHGEEVH